MNAPPFKPSQVRLEVIPLVATMGKAEIELTAAGIVRALALSGDAWEPIPLARVADIAREDVERQLHPYHHWWKNPFVQPAPWLMVERGFAVFGAGDSGPTIAFTDKGCEALRRCVLVDHAPPDEGEDPDQVNAGEPGAPFRP